MQAAAAANINIQERKKKNLKQELKRQDSVPDNLFKKAGGVRERDHPSCGSNSVKCVIHYSINFFLPFYFFFRGAEEEEEEEEEEMRPHRQKRAPITHGCFLPLIIFYFFFKPTAAPRALSLLSSSTCLYFGKIKK